MDGHRCFHPVPRGAWADRESPIMRSLFELLEWAGYLLFLAVGLYILYLTGIGIMDFIGAVIR